MRRIAFSVLFALIVSGSAALFIYLSPTSSAQDGNNRQKKEKFQKIERGPGKRMAVDKAGIRRLKNKTGDTAEVETSEATGAARFVKFKKGKGNLSSLSRGANARNKSDEFFKEFGSMFGVDREGVELRFDEENVDAQGTKHQTFKQYYKGVPVFAGVLKTHFDNEEQLNAVNGTAVPEIEVDTNPTLSQLSATDTAIALVADQKGESNLSVKGAKLYVYRTGLVEGVPGDDYLAYELEVTNGLNVREFVYVDAHSGKIVDQFTGVYDALSRRAYNGNGLPQNQIPTFYPGTPYWVEGQAFPTASNEANNMIIASKETYDLFFNAFGRDSFDGTGATMDAIFNRGYSCPNASWNGIFISFCPGMTSDDVTAHEWGHAYTQFTHNLIYAYQPGALNESYSDIFGETVDRINNRDDIGNSEGDAPRTADSCSTFSPASPRFYINSPEVIAGQYGMGRAIFGPGYSNPGVTADIVIAQDVDEDGAGTVNTTTDGCSPLTNAAAIAGKIALIDRGQCGFKLKTKNAQDAGAAGVIIANIATSANSLINMADDPTVPAITIPAIQVLLSTGNAIRSQLANGVNASIKATNNTDVSTRWLVGEDDTAAGLAGALRDMHDPTCYSNPGKMSDSLYYSCDIYPGSDGGGVHTNSGIPNHAFALLVDGGTYNGQTIESIGLTKAAHIYYRAMAVYQVVNSNFADHADSLEQSTLDLINSGQNLADLKTGQPSGQIVTQSDLEQVKKAMLAVEMRQSPTFCGINAILDKDTPDDPYGADKRTFFLQDFEGSLAGWTQGREMTSPNAAARVWGVSSDLPARAGRAAVIADPNYSCAATATDQTGILYLTSPNIQLPNNLVGPRLSFDHRVATERGYDGGQIRVSIDGGPFELIPDTAFIFNPYNATLFSAPGNSNPRAGQKAFTGNDETRASGFDGSWGTSIIDLSGIASPGQTVQLRWEFGNDFCGGASYWGWWVDDVDVYGLWVDTDGDGVADIVDSCPGTDPAQSTIVIGSGKHGQTGVPNYLFASGCSFQQLIDAAKSAASSHGAYVTAVDSLTSQWVADGLITSAQKDAIMRAAAKNK